MWQTIILSFCGGLLGANAIPHFVKGITKDSFPCLLGNSPVPNVIGGWILFMLAAACAYGIDVRRYAMPSFAAGAAGVLAMGLFHAWYGADRVNALFGRGIRPDGRG